MDGLRIADDWADLTDGRLTNLILDDENGDRVPTVTDYMGTRIGYSCSTSGTIDQYNVLTGTGANGTAGENCMDSSSTSSLALVGSTLRGDLATANRWTQAVCVLPESCQTRLWRVYCFELPAE